MYFKDIPQFLYDFNYGNGVSKTTVVADITRNVRVRKEILQNVTVYDEYDVIDGETPEIISEKFYGTPEYHWIIMLANEKYDWLSDFPLTETELIKHIASAYNPTLFSDNWYWKKEDGVTYIYLKITSGVEIPFDYNYLTAPVKIKLYDETQQFIKHIDFPYDEITLDNSTQYFRFPYGEEGTFGSITQFGDGTEDEGVGNVRIYVDTEGRENNPVMFVNTQGYIVNADSTDATLIPLTGAELHRIENDMKRRIKIISPDLIEVILRNYEELLE